MAEIVSQVLARYRPEDACRPVLDDAPVFYPSEEVFMLIPWFYSLDI